MYIATCNHDELYIRAVRTKDEGGIEDEICFRFNRTTSKEVLAYLQFLLGEPVVDQKVEGEQSLTLTGNSGSIVINCTGNITIHN